MSRLRRIKFNQHFYRILERIPVLQNKLEYFGSKGIYTVDNEPYGTFNMVSTNSIMDNRLMRKGLYYNEPNSKKIWKNWCLDSIAVCDVGANIGQFTLLALSSSAFMAFLKSIFIILSHH